MMMQDFPRVENNNQESRERPGGRPDPDQKLPRKRTVPQYTHIYIYIYIYTMI